MGWLALFAVVAGFLIFSSRGNKPGPPPPRNKPDIPSPWQKPRRPKPPIPARPPRTTDRSDRANWSKTPPELPSGHKISGKCYVIDGDTIVIRKIKVRLKGIDAPELDEPWGQKSKWAMVHLCKGQVITARFSGETSHDRLVGTCYLPDGRDIGAEIIKQGLAVDWPLFSGGKYQAFEPMGVRGKLRRPPYNR